jgi:hypothetical protein
VKIQILAFVKDSPINVNFHYSTKNPYAVGMTVLTEPPVPWAVDRELLRDGLSRPSGEGDIRITPTGNRVEIELSPPSGRAVLEFRREDLVEMLRATVVVVPFGREVIDWSEAAKVFPGVIA